MSNINKPQNQTDNSVVYHFFFLDRNTAINTGANVWGTDFMHCVSLFNEQYSNVHIHYIMDKTGKI